MLLFDTFYVNCLRLDIRNYMSLGIMCQSEMYVTDRRRRGRPNKQTRSSFTFGRNIYLNRKMISARLVAIG